jgi:hypothetical protein
LPNYFSNCPEEFYKKNILIIKEYPEEILIKLAIVLKISELSRNTDKAHLALNSIYLA